MQLTPWQRRLLLGTALAVVAAAVALVLFTKSKAHELVTSAIATLSVQGRRAEDIFREVCGDGAAAVAAKRESAVDRVHMVPWAQSAD